MIGLKKKRRSQTATDIHCVVHGFSWIAERAGSVHIKNFYITR